MEATADIKDSDSCELKLHVGSTPIRRTIFYYENKYFYGVITDKKSKWESNTEGGPRRQEIDW